MEKLVLLGRDKTVVRTFHTGGAKVAKLIQRQDNRRVELLADTTSLEKSGIEFDEIAKVDFDDLKTNPLEVSELGQLCFVENIERVQVDVENHKENDRAWHFALLGLVACGIISGVLIGRMPAPQKLATSPIPPEVHSVQVVPKPEKLRTPMSVMNFGRANVNSANSKVSVNRLGALSVLGSLRGNSGQRGGIEMNAIATSAGPGRGGGTGGSGGVQTSLYGRGLVAAPVGVGGNIRGAGGYGTAGKGGGQAGYGELTMVGSSGTGLVPLGEEATVETGLDRDMIAAVIQKNMGQVRYCYEQGLQMNPQLSGRVAMNFTIGGMGQVKIASVANSTLNAASVEQCIVMRLKTWKFPVPAGGADVKVSYPFLLKRAGG